MDPLSTAASIDVSAYYIWEVPGKPVTIYLSHEAIDRILGEATRVPQGAPADAEIGGLLLGVSDVGARLTVRIEDVALVSIEYTFGASYVLTEADRENLRAAIQKWAPSPGRRLNVVGFFRKHRRSGLGLTREDLGLMQSHFSDPSMVALLVKPRPMLASLAGFFFWEQGRIHPESSYLEFPIRARGSERSAPAPETPPAQQAEPQESQPAPTAVPTEAPVPDVPLPGFLSGPADEDKKKSWWKRAPKTEDGGDDALAEPPPAPEASPAAEEPWWKRLPRPKSQEPEPSAAEKPRPVQAGQPFWVSWWVVVPICAYLIVVEFALGFIVAREVRNPPLHSAAAPRDPYALSLMVVEYRENLCLTWDHHAPAILQSERAMLWITDGDTSRVLSLDSAVLRNPGFGVTYHRLTNQVKFRLEVIVPKGRTVSESWELAATTATPPPPSGSFRR